MDAAADTEKIKSKPIFSQFSIQMLILDVLWCLIFTNLKILSTGNSMIDNFALCTLYLEQTEMVNAKLISILMGGRK